MDIGHRQLVTYYTWFINLLVHFYTVVLSSEEDTWLEIKMTDMKSKSVFKIMFSKWWRLVLRLRKKIEIRKTENNFSCQNVENGLHLPSKHVWAWIPVWCLRVRVFNATFKNISIISWWLFLLVEEKGVPGENHRPVASHWQTISHDVV
jgi:hypothetical protein